MELLFSSVSLVLVWRQRAVLRAKQADPACSRTCHAPKTSASQVGQCERAECIRIACDVRDKFAACKHSKYRVGAALSAGEGIRVIRTGVNVESDSCKLRSTHRRTPCPRRSRRPSAPHATQPPSPPLQTACAYAASAWLYSKRSRKATPYFALWRWRRATVEYPVVPAASCWPSIARQTCR